MKVTNINGYFVKTFVLQLEIFIVREVKMTETVLRIFRKICNSKNLFQKQASKRSFSSAASSTTKGLAFGLGAFGVTGLTYLNYMGH